MRSLKHTYMKHVPRELRERAYTLIGVHRAQFESEKLEVSL